MGKTIALSLDEAQRTALEKGAKYGSTPSYRRRCQAILKKAQGQTVGQIAKELSCCTISVHDWIRRFRHEGIAGVAVRRGRGRPCLLSEADLPAVRTAVQNNRRRVTLALNEIEQTTGKSVSALTLRRTLKKMVDASNDCDA